MILTDEIRRIHAAMVIAEATGFTGYARELRAMLNLMIPRP